MTRLLAKSVVLALAGVPVAALLSLTAFGSAGRSLEAQSTPPRTSPSDGGKECSGSSDVCEQGTRCRPAQPGSKKLLCLPVAKLGESCGPATAGCEDPTFCDESLRCVLGQAERGQACAAHAECKAPLVCPWGKHVCSIPAKIGQSCHTNPGGRSECEPGAGCNGTRCVAQKADGQDCTTDEECRAGLCEKTGCARGPSLAKR
jgi:hypothetical protein